MTRKPNLENIQLAECIGNVRALLIGIFCDDIFKDIATDEGECNRSTYIYPYIK